MRIQTPWRLDKRLLVSSMFLLLVGFGWLVNSSDSADPPSSFVQPPTEFECRWADGPITIDGKADDASWKNAMAIDRFYLAWLGKNIREARTKTSAKLLWDREYLYFFADMEDSDLYADVKEHDGMCWDNDVFELFFKPATDKPGYYEFQVNALGTIMDMFIPRRGAGGYKRFKSDGDFHIQAKVKLDGTLNKWSDQDKGWSVEGKIPWTDFMKTGGRPNIDEKWKFTLCRYDYSVAFEGPETSACANLKTNSWGDFHRYEDYATLKFVGPSSKSEKPRGIDKRIPLTTSTVIGSPDPALPYRPKRVYPNLEMHFPIIVTHQPHSDRLLYITQEWPYGETVLRRMKDQGDTTQSEVLWEMKGTGYDIVFHPDFQKNGYFYVGWNGGSNKGRMTRVTRFTMSLQEPYKVDLASEKTIIEWLSDGHNGGAICFGKDGMMYITSGDGTSDSDTNVTGQDMTKPLSKVLRIDVDHPEEGKPYSVPKDNPFVGQKDIVPETWAYGLRNPWRITCDAKTGHIWVGNNGQDLFEQIYFVRKGDNYGWSVFEGSQPFYRSRKLGPTPHVNPTLEHHHSEARSLTGGLVYYGKKLPELVGAYIYGDYATGRIWAAKHDGEKVVWHKEIARTMMKITGFGTDSQGELLICDHAGNKDGGFYTLEPTPTDLPPSKFPRKLSESGLFQNVPGHVMMPGIIPYSVNAPFWSDGAIKHRYIAMPGADSKIEFTRFRGWNFPDQTVIVKSFQLEMEEGNPDSRRWIETRFMTKQGPEWYGYTYIWNDEQTDATLIDSKGLDKSFTIQTKEGKKEQIWHYPSRAECMVCHGRAPNFVLGLCEVQMNKEHDYNGVKENQLHLLERLGMLKVNWQEESREEMKQELMAKGMNEKQANEYLDRQMSTKDQRSADFSSLLTFPINKYRHLVDPFDAKQDLHLRAKSYLHSNCSSCHVMTGGGNAQMELDFITKDDKMNLFDVKPIHNTFGLPEARLVAPGHPESSVLLHRIGHRKQGYMPPLSTNLVDEKGVQLIREWIEKMPQPAKK